MAPVANPRLGAARPFRRALRARGYREKLVHSKAASTDVSTVPQASREASLDASSTSGLEEGAASGCPVLRTLTLPPPSAKRPWWLFFTDPLKDQAAALAGSNGLVTDRFLGSPAIIVADVELAREVLVQADGSRVQVGWPASTVAMLGPGSVATVHDQRLHRSLRKIMNTGLSTEAVDQALPAVVALADSYLESWAAAGRAGRTVRAHEEMRRFTFEVICKVVLDLELPEADMAHMARQFGTWLSGLFTPLTLDVPPLPFHYALKARRRLVEYIKLAVNNARRAQMSVDYGGASPQNQGASPQNQGASPQNQGARASLLQQLLAARLEDGGALSEEQVLDNCLTILFAGHDTSSSVLTHVLHQLAMNPQLVARLRAEQAEVVAACGPAITPAALRQMRLAEATIRECMRVRPPVASVLRDPLQPLQLGGHAAPPSHVLSIALGHMSKHDAACTGPAGSALDPAAFNPDRHLGPDGRLSISTGQVPFGLGPRTCPGSPLAMAEMRVLLAQLLRRYSFTADWNCSWVNFPIPKPRNGMPIFVTRLPASQALA